MNRSNFTAAASLALLFTVAAALPGCSSNPAGLAYERAVSKQLDAADIAALEADLDAGSIQLARVPDRPPLVRARLASSDEARAHNAALNARLRDDGVLTVHIGWPAGFLARSQDHAALDIRLPAADSIDADVQNGPISVRGFDAVLNAATLNGAVTVRDHRGPVRVRTQSGPITLRDVAGAVVARTTNGSITLHTLEPAGAIDLHSSNGTVDLHLHHAFTGVLTLTTSNGSIDLDDIQPHAEVLSLTPRSATLRFNDADQPRSTVRTSNGDIRVRLR